MRPIRLGLVCDFREEGWTSMDLVSDMLFEQLSKQHSSEVCVERLCPPFRRVFSRMPVLGKQAASWNADRLWNRFRTYPVWLRDRARDYDLFHLVDHSYAQLNFEIPPERTVLYCHDLDTFRCLLEPELEPRPAWFRAMARRILEGLSRAAHVFTVSQSTHDQILRYQLVAPERLSVSYLGLHPAYTGERSIEGDRKAEELLGPAGPGAIDILHVGSQIPRKRLDVVLRVFAQIRARFPAARLIRVGGMLNPVYRQLACDLGVSGAVISMPYLDHLTLAAVYRRSSVLLQTSDAEGFGLPVAEALACGCPVVASDLPALREAGARAARFCPVGDIEQWSATVVKLLEDFRKDQSLHQQSIHEGQLHAARFSWAETARNNLAIYRSLVN